MTNQANNTPNPPNNTPDGPEGPLDVRTVVLLGAAVAAVYVTYEHPGLGTPLTVGIALLLALHLLMKR